MRIDVIDRNTDEVVDSITKDAQEPNIEHTAGWNGKVAGSKRSASSGDYKFRVGPVSGKLASSDTAGFQFRPLQVPGARRAHLRRRGRGAAGRPRARGTGRAGPVRNAAAGGPRRPCAVPGLASPPRGNYIVIDGKGTGHDYVYMHLKKPSPLKEGDKVRTGQKIGVVGETGDATGCHLHFEEWSAPGWYEGGHYMKAVTRHLKKWDSWS